MKLRDALYNPEKLSSIDAEKFVKLGLLNADRMHTDLTVRLLAGDRNALRKVLGILFPRPNYRGPDWVNPPFWIKPKRVFRPARNSGDLVAFSIDF